VARDRYLWRAGEDHIHDPENELNNPDKKQKRENFWYYHKWQVILGVVVLFFVVYFSWDLFTKENPDYEVAILSETNFPSNQLLELEEVLEQVGEDRNGDGKVVVFVNCYAIASENTQIQDANLQMASVTKYMNDMTEGQSMIYMVDDALLKEFQTENPLFRYADETLVEVAGDNYADKGVRWTDYSGLMKANISRSEEGLTGFENLNICLHNLEGTALADNPERVQYYQDSKELLDRLK
jgi:hypothetical protein